jgi:hypothetical protein
MTPNEMLREVQAVTDAEEWQTGGGCGAIGVPVSDEAYILITPADGPWGYGRESDTDLGQVWRVALHFDDGSWVDSELMPDGDSTCPADLVPTAVRVLLDESANCLPLA